MYQSPQEQPRVYQPTSYPQQQTSYPPQQLSYPPQPFMPQPQAKKPKKWPWIVACIFCLIIGYAAGAGSKSTSTTTNVNATPQATAASQGKTSASQPTKASGGRHEVGQTVTTNKWQLVVNKAVADQGSDMMKPKDGYVFLEIDITMKNLTNETQTASSLIMWDVKSASDGQKQKVSISDKPSLDGKVEAGGSLTGTLTYEVPTSVKKYTLSFQGGMVDNAFELWDITL